MSKLYKFIRIFRPNTLSWINFELPKAMNFAKANDYVKKHYPGWIRITVYKVKFIRIFRPNTNSWITFELPKVMDFGDELEEYVKQYYPGWILVQGCMINPDDA